MLGVVMVACLSWSCAGERAQPDAKPAKSSFIPAAEWASERSEEVLISVLSDVFYVNGERIGQFVVNPKAPWTPVSVGFDEALKRAAAKGAKSCLIVMSQDVKVASLVSVDASCVRHVSKNVSLGKADFEIGVDGELGVNLLMQTKAAVAEDSPKHAYISVNHGRDFYSIFIDGKRVESNGNCSEYGSVCHSIRAELDKMLVEKINVEIKGRKESWRPVLQFSPNDSVGDIAVLIDRLRVNVGEPEFALIYLKGCSDGKRTDETYHLKGRFDIPPMVGDFCDKDNVKNTVGAMSGALGECIRNVSDKGLYGRWILGWMISCDGSPQQIHIVDRSSRSEGDVEQCLMRVVEGMRFMTPSHGGICLVEYPFVVTAE